ncbi:tetraacyldisaccharide 4'-kinase [Chthonobacter albigriseus]|uniref:tetraacyldisaccharide 4'-kinase n=1 Tax=Chthonobacter albigriseus TaxID=1683161 RepID=UPI0015EE68A8|nr:tetraacyldisaccharide 4'-kinase [Chthonobacter albigriseus]
MRAPDFWWRRTGLAALVLSPLSALYASMARQRMTREGEHPPIPVICIGNFVAGGAGKTPTALAVARIAIEMGLKPVFLTRGYRGFLSGPVLIDQAVHTAAHVGDEAMLLARLAPTVVSRDRAAAIPLLASLDADLCIMDDGFQNPGLAKTLSMVVIDAATGAGNGWCLPSGPLRAPMVVQMRAAGAVVVMGEGSAAGEVVRAASRAAKPVLRARLAPRNPEAFRGMRVLAFAGIGRPEKFYTALREAGADVVDTVSFPDHHPFSTEDARRVLKRADADDLEPVTTEKDEVRLRHGAIAARSELAVRAHVFAVDCVFEDPGFVRALIEEARSDFARGRR